MGSDDKDKMYSCGFFPSHFLFQIFDSHMKGLRRDLCMLNASVILKSYVSVLFYLNRKIIARVG